MNRKATNTMPFNSTEENLERISLELPPDHRNLPLHETRSKRKAPECFVPIETPSLSKIKSNILLDNLTTRPRPPLDDEFEFDPHANEVFAFRKLGYNEPVSPRGRYSFKQASTVDDLGMIQGLPKKRQRYQRRNSFLVRRDSSRTLFTSHPTIMQDINDVCFGPCTSDTLNMHSSGLLDFSSQSKGLPRQGEENAHDNNVKDKLVQDGLVFQPPSKFGISKEDKVGPDSACVMPQEMTCVTSVRRIDHVEKDDSINRWGNASWANSDDTYWYSGFSSLSFDSKPTIPASTVLASVQGDKDQSQTRHSRLSLLSATQGDEWKEMLPPEPLVAGFPLSKQHVITPKEENNECEARSRTHQE